MTAQFDIKQDNEIEAAGGFFCQACLTGKPVSEQAADPRYCLGCYEMIEAEKTCKKESSPINEGWSPDKMLYITGGHKWGVAKNLQTVCLGMAQETAPDGTENPPDKQAVVTKPITKGIPTCR